MYQLNLQVQFEVSINFYFLITNCFNDLNKLIEPEPDHIPVTSSPNSAWISSNVVSVSSTVSWRRAA